MVRIQIIGNITFLTRPCFESLKLGFRLRHVAVKIIKIAQSFGAGAGVGVGWVEALVVLDVDEDVVGAGFGEEVLVLGEVLDGGFGDEDVDVAADGVEGDGVVGWVGGEDCDGVAGGEGVNGGFVGFWVVGGGVGWEGGEGDVEVVVDRGDVFLEVGS